VTRIARHAIEDMFRLSQKYLFYRTQKLDTERRFKSASDPVRKWLAAKDDDGKWVNGEEDAEGNRVFYFDQSLTGADGRRYAGVMLRRAQGAATFDEKEVLAFAHTDARLAHRLVKTIEVADLDELYVLQQEGWITEAQLRGLMHTPAPTYALWPLEATELTEE
jgi:hypothetical protein